MSISASPHVTHDQKEAFSMSDRIAALDDGVIQQLAAPVERYERPQNAFVGENNHLRGKARSWR
ncbi:hypothetical protein H8B02_43975 [Bradyrhizobium sp. Pear77]|uniref:hypothetical protein n=1 Tax=Bradyrhizobium altum TaxID=1571202 RepID=UPI001E5F8B8E|nr:hypothetical protein [Bradyrhizobium altum]MCC8960118.1 hypothetical protein [Bradyrhizobium altum]